MLTYEVDRISIVLPTEIGQLLHQSRGMDYVHPDDLHALRHQYATACWCAATVSNTRESQKHVRVTADATRIDPIITAPVIALPMLAVLLIWLLVTTRKRPKAGRT